VTTCAALADRAITGNPVRPSSPISCSSGGASIVGRSVDKISGNRDRAIRSSVCNHHHDCAGTGASAKRPAISDYQHDRTATSPLLYDFAIRKSSFVFVLSSSSFLSQSGCFPFPCHVSPETGSLYRAGSSLSGFVSFFAGLE
jgi:hypothetical protein